MADKAINFFNPSDVLSLSASGWVQQQNNITDSVQRAQGLGATGDEAAKKTYDGKAAGSVVYDCFTETGNLTLPKVGQIAGGYHIDSLSLVYSPNGWPRLTVNVHQHDSNSHTSGLNTFTPSLTCPAQWGVPRALSISDLDTSAGVRGCTYTVGCTHEDESENGDHLAGENRDGVETLAYEFTVGAAALGAEFAGPSGWDEMSDGSPKGNTSAETRSMQWEHHIARDA